MSEGQQRIGADELLREVGEIARVMTSTRSIDAIMQDVLSRTRRLTGADMAYISLNRGSETFIRFHEGIRTEGYRTIRMPLGTGVLGKAATGREAVMTRGYLFDGSLVHLPDIDQRVQDEGVQSILGMPMTLHGAVLGALLIADRRDVDYTPEVFHVLRTLALHTAVALEHASRMDEVTAALARLHESRDLDHERLLDLQEALHLEERLLESIVDEGDLDTFARTVVDVLGVPVTILDADGRRLGAWADSSRAGGAESWPGGSGSAEVGRLVWLSRTTAQPVVGTDVTVVCALGAGEHLATLVLHSALPPALHPRLQRIVVFLGIIQLMARAQRTEASRRERVLLDAFTGLGSRTSAVEAELAGFGIGPGAPHRLLCVSADAQDGEPGDALEALREVILREVGSDQLSTGSGRARVLAARHEEHLCLLVPEDVWETAIRGAVEGEISRRPGMAGGLSGAITDRAHGPLAHRAAEQARRTLELLGATGRVASGEGLGAAGLLADAMHQQPGVPTPLAQLDPLIAYDREHRSDLMRTAWVLAESGGNVAHTAERLFVHQNTVRQRMARIGDLIGGDWREPARFLDIHLALRMWALGNG